MQETIAFWRTQLSRKTAVELNCIVKANCRLALYTTVMEILSSDCITENSKVIWQICTYWRNLRQEPAINVFALINIFGGCRPQTLAISVGTLLRASTGVFPIKNCNKLQTKRNFKSVSAKVQTSSTQLRNATNNTQMYYGIDNVKYHCSGNCLGFQWPVLEFQF